jgi:hypothetical protein
MDTLSDNSAGQSPQSGTEVRTTERRAKLGAPPFSPRRLRGLRALAFFWVSVVATLSGGVAVLQYLGPPGRPVAAEAPSSAPSADPASAAPAAAPLAEVPATEPLAASIPSEPPAAPTVSNAELQPSELPPSGGRMVASSAVDTVGPSPIAPFSPASPPETKFSAIDDGGTGAIPAADRGPGEPEATGDTADAERTATTTAPTADGHDVRHTDRAAPSPAPGATEMRQPARPAPDHRGCRDILITAQLGEELSDADRSYLRRSCTARN